MLTHSWMNASADVSSLCSSKMPLSIFSKDSRSDAKGKGGGGMQRRGRGVNEDMGGGEARSRARTQDGMHGTVPFKISTAVEHAVLMSEMVSKWPRKSSDAPSSNEPNSSNSIDSPSTAVFSGVRNSWDMYLTLGMGTDA